MVKGRVTDTIRRKTEGAVEKEKSDSVFGFKAQGASNFTVWYTLTAPLVSKRKGGSNFTLWGTHSAFGFKA